MDDLQRQIDELRCRVDALEQLAAEAIGPPASAPRETNAFTRRLVTISASASARFHPRRLRITGAGRAAAKNVAQGNNEHGR